jgi:hypothetical protein
MQTFTHAIIFVAMCLLTAVSMSTTYVSLSDSILPGPVVEIPLGQLGVWPVSALALGLSLAIGLMLFGLKLAIVNGHKRLGVPGFLGLFLVAFISIVFNMDVLYRLANEDFFLRYATSKVKSSYLDYLAAVRTELLEERVALEKQLATQQGELEAEIRGLRDAPAGYGERAREEEHRLTVMERAIAVDLEAIDAALATQERVDDLVVAAAPATVGEVEQLQSELRVAVKEAGALAGIPLPEPVSLENQLFAVFERLVDVKRLGMLEVFLLLVAIFIDLGDILGYSLVPNRRKTDASTARSTKPGPVVEAVPLFAPLQGSTLDDEVGRAHRGQTPRTGSPEAAESPPRRPPR